MLSGRSVWGPCHCLKGTICASEKAGEQIHAGREAAGPQGRSGLFTQLLSHKRGRAEMRYDCDQSLNP